MIKISIFNKEPNLKIKDSNVRELVHLALNKTSYEKINLNFVFCNNETLNDFKLKYFNDDVLTDIVTFPLRNDSELEAEIYISSEMANVNAQQFKVSLNNEISRLIVHGILHLIGFDDSSEQKKKSMFKKQEQIISNYNKQVCYEI
ncbi:MAG: rRNA maturation RNase YbeY [Candidatus Neomarinimicrobiota bacterium]|tara:strand:+ start:3332 stop:3769 length:438 start_codon:yes stop_codon:yes gene_type:complete